MIDHDRLFKELLTTFFVEFLDLFVPQLAAQLDPATISFLDKEVFTDVRSGESHEAGTRPERLRPRRQEISAD